ncbi:MAG: glycosyltransferase family 39 protein [Candidatus Nealsonbacteria bacterium]|nr:glycosyltransferase family 39 protein [Candidatus Nealsonbacteria bacterium]
MQLSNKLTNIICVVVLAFIFLISALSMKGDALTFDELAHLPAGYSYLTQKDYRLNPEHPPLVKDFSALPLLFMNINFPKDSPAWQEGSQGRWWVQFNFGSDFLYRSGNDADKIIFWARVPMILILLFLGWFAFRWAKELGGNKLALLVLTVFSFSPTFIANGRFVTTDVAAALGATLATYYYLKFLKNPSKKNIIFGGLALGISLLFKFSLILLFPFFAVITIVFIFLENGNKFKNLLKYIFPGFALLFLALGVIWLVYGYHMINYPSDLQYSETKAFLETTAIPKPIINLNLAMTKNPVTRPIAQYAEGLLMATNRTATGNTTYFFGMVSAAGWWFYFPVVYFIKLPLAFHLLTLISILASAVLIKKIVFKEILNNIKNWVRNHFTEFSMMIFVLIYWITSMAGSLNIGVRHLLPSLPFIFILTCLGINNFLNNIKKAPFKKAALFLIIILLGWYIGSSLMVFPYFLTYFNETVGGPKNGYKYVVDSNLDWGQDFKRLKSWMEENNVNKIYIDYFGGADLDYYIKGKYVRWDGKKSPNDLPKGNYLVVSANQLQGGRAMALPDYTERTDYYDWLNQYNPVAFIGNSIFVYYIK